MKIAQILRNAQQLIATPEQWIQKAEWAFMDANGKINYDVPPEQGNCFCSIGAIYNALCTASNYIQTCTLAMVYLKAGIGGYVHSIPDWNDTTERTHSDVWQAFERAIYRAEQDGM